MKLLIVILLVSIDFLTKKIVFNNIELNNFVPLMPFLDIAHIHNYGISFGLFANFLSPNFIILIGLTIIIILLYWMHKSNDKLEKLGLLLIIIGAISNIFDRVINNYVLDFIFLHYKEYYWPAFNFADIYISIGALLIIVVIFRTFINQIKEKNG